MPYNYSEIMQAQAERISAESAAWSAELEAGRLSHDADRVNEAADRILQLDAQRNALAVRANRFVASQQPQQQQGNRFGLSRDEIDVAHQHPNSRMSNEQKQQLYAQNKQRYQHARQTGAYRDDQGAVRR